MRLLNYDFYDLFDLIVYFRSSPAKFSLYRESIEQIITYIELPIGQGEVETNSIRKILRSNVENSEDVLLWMQVDNVYTAKTRIIKSDACYTVIKAVLREMLRCFEDKQRFVMLCDATHNVPLILADERKPKKIIKTMVKTYQKNYNKDFLVKELRGL